MSVLRTLTLTLTKNVRSSHRQSFVSCCPSASLTVRWRSWGRRRDWEAAGDAYETPPPCLLSLPLRCRLHPWRRHGYQPRQHPPPGRRLPRRGPARGCPRRVRSRRHPRGGAEEARDDEGRSVQHQCRDRKVPLFCHRQILAQCLCSATDYSIVDFTMARKHELWMAEHGRVYKDEAERARRFEIFKDNVKYIEDFNNAGEYSYTLGVNHFADLTHEEFLAMYVGGSAIPDEEPVRSIKYETTSEPLDVSVPSSVDWRAEGAVTPVVDQGGCDGSSATISDSTNSVE